MIPIPSIVTGVPIRHTLLFRKLLFRALGNRNCAFVLLMLFSCGHSFLYEVLRYRLCSKQAVFVAILLVEGGKVFMRLLVVTTAPMVGG